MVVEVRLYATLRRYVPSAAAGVFSASIPDGSSLDDLLAVIRINPAEVHMVMVNGKNAPWEYKLQEGDRIGLFPPVGGG